MQKGVYSVIFTLIVTLLFATPTYAAEPSISGLLISPPRYYVEVSAGESISQQATIANYTDQPLDISLDVESFTVANLSYEYQIKSVTDPWIHFEQTSLHLDANKSQVVKFTAAPPSSVTPGGKYYLVVASATTQTGGLKSTIQVAAPVYITVRGDTLSTSTLAAYSQIPHVIFGSSAPFQLDVANTGNVHYQVVVKGEIAGLFGEKTATSADHILLPDTTRRFNASIPAPLLPGYYNVNYGYYSDSSGNVLVRTWILYLPPWSLVGIVLIVWVSILISRRIKAKRRSQRAL